MKRFLLKHALILSMIYTLFFGLVLFFIAIIFAMYYFQPNKSDILAISTFACSFAMIGGIPTLFFVYLTITRDDKFHAEKRKKEGK